MDSPVRVDPKVRALRAIVERLTAKLPPGEGNFAWHQVHADVGHLADAAEALHTLYLTRNPLETEAAHFKRTHLEAARLGKYVTATLNHIIKVTGDGHANAD